MLNLLIHWKAKSALLLGMSIASTGIASAQASITATRGAEITPFVQSTLLSPDWGPTRNLGFTAGVDYTRFIPHSLLQPSLELRFTDANGSTVGEKTYTGGFKLGTTIHGLHPYATLLAGTGAITFMHPVQTYYNDTSFVYSIGAGAEFNVRPAWKVRLDFSQQHWDLDPQLLTPIALSVGLSYRIPFRGRSWEH